MAGRSSNQLRIIGGQWRSRRIRFPDRPALRPSPDRVRETLFNWLASGIVGSRCLDLFAGSGALGLEALSRGAALTCFVDHDSLVIQQLGDNLKLLGAKNVELVQSDVNSFLQGTPHPFDIVFLDPPFHQQQTGPCLQALGKGWLADQARVYIEHESSQGTPPLPPGWQILRSKQTGQVAYSLLQAP